MVIWDNSESTSIQKGNYEGKRSYLDVLEELNLQDSSRVTYSLYSMGGTIEPSKPDSLELNSSETNLYNAIEAIKNREKDVSGALLLTDGIFNQGRSPVFEAANLEIPVITVALGDTSEQKDLIVEEVISNNTGYVNTLHSVEARISSRGFAGQEFEIRLLRGGEVIQQETVRPANNRSSHSVNFELELQEEGLQQYSVMIPDIQEEWTFSNNTQPFAVDVINEKQRILSLAFEIHPDVRTARSLLLQDRNTRLISRTWTGGSRFIEGDFTLSADTLELLILHGFPYGGLPEEIDNKIRSLIEQLPTIFMATPRTSFQAMQQISGNTFPITFSRAGDFERVTLLPKVEPTAHPIMELPEISFEILPSLMGPLQNSTLLPASEALFASRFQGTDTQQPLIAIREVGNIRKTQINGYNWFHFAMNSNSEVRNYWSQLFTNIVSWTATKPDNRRLKIQPSQKVFNGSEPIILNASLTNESGETVTDGIIDIELSGEEIDTRFYSMANVGDGEYRLTINSLPHGIYKFNATARKGNRTIDSQQGELSVSTTNSEYINTIRNDGLLQQIASTTGGAFFTFSELSGIQDTLNKKGMLTREEKVNTTVFYPYQHSLWFILVITLLTIEWLTRKYLALT